MSCTFEKQTLQRFLILLQVLSPWNMTICSIMKAIPVATLNHAIDRNWLISNCAKITANPEVLKKREQDNIN